MLWFIVEYSFVWAILLLLLFLTGSALVFGEEVSGKWWRDRGVLLGILFMLGGPAGIFGLYSFLESEPGKWAAIDDDSSMEQLTRFLVSFPGSEHRPEVESHTREEQDKVLQSTDGRGVSYKLLSELRGQSLPARLGYSVIANRDLQSVSANRGRYASALDEFEEEALQVFTEEAADFSPVVVSSETDGPPYDIVTIVIAYATVAGREYVQYPREYHFDAIELHMKWAIYAPGHDLPAITGAAQSSEPPHTPRWEGSKNPEQVIADIVTSDVLRELETQVRGSRR